MHLKLLEKLYLIIWPATVCPSLCPRFLIVFPCTIRLHRLRPCKDGVQHPVAVNYTVVSIFSMISIIDLEGDSREQSSWSHRLPGLEFPSVLSPSSSSLSSHDSMKCRPSALMPESSELDGDEQCSILGPFTFSTGEAVLCCVWMAAGGGFALGEAVFCFWALGWGTGGFT